MEFRFEAFCEKKHSQLWDDFCKASHNGTFIVSRKFLSYHGNKFIDKSILIYNESNHLLGLFPAAQDPKENSTIISHPGTTYAGLIHSGQLNAVKQEILFPELIKLYKEQGYKKIIYKAIPSIFHQIPSEDDIYTLFKINAINFRTDLSCATPIKFPLQLSQRRFRSLKKSKNIGAISANPSLTQFWSILESNLKKKYGTTPTHTLKEIQTLLELFPNNIQLCTAEMNSEIQAGILIFIQNRTIHLQYIASSDLGHKNSLLDLVINHIAEKFSSQDYSWLNFGISTEQNGLTLNHGLYQFKCEFGGGGVTYKQFEIGL